MKTLPWGTKQNLKDEEFYNRTQELSNIKNLLNSTSEENAPDILLTGIRGVGKTVFLKKIKKDLEKEYLIIYLDFSNAECFQKNKMSVTGIMEYYFKEIIKECKRQNLTTIDKKISKFFNTNEFHIKDITDINGFPVPIPTKNINDSKLNEFVLSLPEEIYKENQDKIKGVMVFIDEFQILKELNNYLNSFLWLLRSYIQNQSNVAYILSGSMSIQDNLIYEIAGQGGAFGGRMLTITLNPFNKTTVENYLKERAPNLLFTNEGFNRFYKCTSGIPAYVNIFGRILPKNIELNENTVKNEFNNAIPNIATHLYYTWNRLSFREQNIIISLIDKPLRRKDIAKYLNVSSGSLSNNLIKLQNLGLIIFENNMYIINEPLLSKWLKLEYNMKGVYPYRRI